jgi:CCR4-NOT transcription complex subunit 10
MSDADQGSVSSQEKGYASGALNSFNSGEYTACLSSLEMLEVLRPSDVKVAHNKIVAQCRAAFHSCSQLPLAEVVKQLEGLAKTAGINLGTGGIKEEEVEWPLLVYNLAVAKFQQKQFIQAAQLSSKLEHSEKTGPGLKKKVYYLNAELSLALRQPEDAIKYTKILQSLVGNSEEDASRLMMLKARSHVLGRQIKSLKKELKSVTLPGSQGITCEFVRSNIEYQCKNYRKSIKMLNSGAQVAGNRVFPHYYNNLGCIHQNMRKPNLAVYYFKNAMEKLDSGNGGGGVEGGNGAPQGLKGEGDKEQGVFNGVPQPQVMYNISISLLHAKRSHIAFELLMEVASSFYLDPHIWFHLAECCIHHLKEQTSQELGHGEVGAGPTHKFIASNPQGPTPVGVEGGEGGIVPSLTYDFAYVCLKNAESLLPKNETGETTGFCQTVGCVGNPLTWTDVDQLRLSILAAKAYVALAVGDFILAGNYAETMLQWPSLPGGYSMLAHLYSAESLIIQDRLTEAIKHLDPANISDTTFTDNTAGIEVINTTSATAGSNTTDVADCRSVMQLNLAVGFALREEWEKASGLAKQLWLVDGNGGGGNNLGVQVLILNLYIALRKGDIAAAHEILLQRYPSLKHSQNSPV